MDDSNRSVRFDLTPQGFHAMVRGGGDVYIEPGGTGSEYICFWASDRSNPGREFTCETDDPERRADVPTGEKVSFGGWLRTFRLAVACTGEYANFHGSTDATGTENAMAAIATLVNRVTGIFEQELGIRFVLIGANDLVIFTNPATDPFSGNLDASLLVQESQAVMDAFIGDIAYDIGHTVSAGAIGGSASLAVVCDSITKARGCTGSATPTGDRFAVDYVCHEIGHQFGATHTFNSTEGRCGSGRRVGSTAYERGAGSTIMSYAGLCGVDNLQSGVDAYFHSSSLQRMAKFVKDNTCSVNTVMKNSPPAADAGADFVIPKQTPFTLKGVGQDPNGDTISFTWEERDKGPAQSLTEPDNGQSPLFRCFPPQESGDRIFPALANVISGTSTPGELLPVLPRTMKFWLVARDGQGGFAIDQAKVRVISDAGPFRGVDVRAGQWLLRGSKKKLQWSVARTDVAPINATHVRILFSADGGQTFPTVLKESTRNDGEHTVTIPDVETAQARIKIEALGNVFWDMSNSDFRVVSNAFNILGTWEVYDEYFDRLESRITFRKNGSATQCDYPPNFDVCESYPYEWMQFGADSGALFLHGYIGPGTEYTVRIPDDDHMVLTLYGSEPLYTFTRI
ncbi:MAG: hypothetical protein HUU46_12775 [Candidatus Hydrogenedentes bacterium]|nr:hypothetical protein [Candidatus Hydrogenedentota bacterium]